MRSRNENFRVAGISKNAAAYHIGDNCVQNGAVFIRLFDLLKALLCVAALFAQGYNPLLIVYFNNGKLDLVAFFNKLFDFRVRIVGQLLDVYKRQVKRIPLYKEDCGKGQFCGGSLGQKHSFDFIFIFLLSFNESG